MDYAKVLRLMRPEQRPKAREWKQEPWVVAEAKLDGHRVTAWVGDDGEAFACGREPTRDVLHCLDAGSVKALRLLEPGTVVDGEAIHPSGGTSADAGSAMAAGEAVFRPFALLRHHGRPLPGSWPEHDAMLQTLGFPAVARVCDCLTRTWQARHGPVEGLRRLAASRGLEGLVLKQHPARGWFKVKPCWTLDAIVHGYAPGEGKHQGRMGALAVGIYDSGGSLVDLGHVGTGFSDQDRSYTAQDWLGTVIEVAYDSVGSGGLLRFPRFLRRRPDKPPSECSTDQLRHL